MTGSLVEFDMLIQGAAIKDVGELCAATDREHRHLEAASLAKQREFPLVTVRLDRTEVLVRVMTVAIGFDVGSPAEDETIETSQYALDVGVARQLHRQSPGGGDRRRIVREVQIELEFVHG